VIVGTAVAIKGKKPSQLGERKWTTTWTTSNSFHSGDSLSGKYTFFFQKHGFGELKLLYFWKVRSPHERSKSMWTDNDKSAINACPKLMARRSPVHPKKLRSAATVQIRSRHFSQFDAKRESTTATK
jgi:hypothetical protein